MKKKILGVLLTLACMISVFPTSVFAEELTTEITEVGSTSSSVSMTYADEHGDYIPTDNFTVTIPKTFSVNPKEDYVYDVNVQGTIDVDRDVWVCTDDTVTLTLTDETLATTYGINKTQTVANTIDKIQYSSEEIADAEGYTQQGTIAKSSLDYEVECEYAGTLNFYINVINENNVMPGTIQQNGFLDLSKEAVLNIIQEYVPANVFELGEELEYNISYYADSLARNVRSSDKANMFIIKYSKGSNTSSTSGFFEWYEIELKPLHKVETSSVSQSSTVTNGKYYTKYSYTVPSQSTSYESLSIHYYPDSNTCELNRHSYLNKWGGIENVTETDTMSAELYLSPRCKLIYE